MKKKIYFMAVALVAAFVCLPTKVFAQWRIGITGGETYNIYTRDNHYMSDVHYAGAWVKLPYWFGTAGVTGQYDVTDWLGVRADFNWTLKNHRFYRSLLDTDLDVQNHYFQLPIMASFSFGSSNVRGFLNLGVYGGYWFRSISAGKYSYESGYISGGIKNYFDSNRDRRLDMGLVGGVGIEWRFRLFRQEWAWQILESRIYYSTRSTQKDYMRVKDPRYNTTIALQTGLYYFF